MKATLKPITSSDAPPVIGPYSQGMDTGSLVFFSGQIPLDPKTGNLVEGGIIEQTAQVFRNIAALLRAAKLDPHHVVKSTVFLTDLNDFPAMNKLYAEFFGDHKPARSTIQVSQLPKQSKIEIEVIACRIPS